MRDDYSTVKIFHSKRIPPSVILRDAEKPAKILKHSKASHTNMCELNKIQVQN